MKCYVYYDGYGNAVKAIGEEELACNYDQDTAAFLKAMISSELGGKDKKTKGHVALVVFDSEQERDAYLQSMGEQIADFGGCRSQCQ